LDDLGSQKNMVFKALVKQLDLKIHSHPEPFLLGWMNKNANLQVTKKCKLRLAISVEYVDEITHDLVPLDIYKVIFGIPYLWERYSIQMRRGNKYRFIKKWKTIHHKSIQKKENDLFDFKLYKQKDW
jgi:hypothetical protein